MSLPRAVNVIGLGNALHGDDGFGVEVARRLAGLALPPGARVFEAGTRGLDVLWLLSGCQRAILVDAEAPSASPGRLRMVAADEVPAPARPGSHQAGLDYLLRAVRALGNSPELLVVTAEAECITPFRPGLSPTLAASVDKAVQLLYDLLHRDAGTGHGG